MADDTNGITTDICMGISFNTEFEPSYGQRVDISPLIRRVVANNPNPFTFTGTGVYLIGRGSVAVIDPGPSLDDHLDAVEAALEPGERIERILVTHTHTDHTAGVDKLQARTGAPTYGFGPHGPVPDAHPLDGLSFDEHFSAEEAEEFRTAWENTPDELKREGPDHDFVPDVAVTDGELIGDTDGRWQVEVVHTPGHTSNHVCFSLIDDGNGDRVLFTGDHVMGWATSVISPPDGDLLDYMNSLSKLLGRDDARYWPTHGPAIENPKDYVRSFIEHRRGREKQIVAALAEGPTSIKHLVPTMYADVDKRLWRAAANSVFAHLLALERQHRVTRHDDGDSSATGGVWSLTGV